MNELVSHSAATLARMIAAGEVSSREVIDAHVGWLSQINPRLNALVQFLFEEAKHAARKSDDTAVAARRAGRALAPLHGLPVTIKDCFDVRGTDCTLGIDTRVGKPAEHDAPLVARLRAVGAIPIGKSNVHQGMLLHEADNPVFGRTNHPMDDQRTPGGSSGGEAALVASFGSPLGLASDMGGSIRQPAHSCGICGLKPTTGRLSTVRSYRVMPGMQAIALQPGPMVRTVEDVDLAMRTLLDTSAVPRQEDELGEPWLDYRGVELDGLRIGYFSDDGYFCPSPAIRRAVVRAAEALRDQGAIVEPITPPPVESMMRICMGLVSSDGLVSLQRTVRGSRVNRQVARQLRLGRVPRVARILLCSLLPRIGQHELAKMVRWTGSRSALEYWDLTAAADAFRATFATEIGGRDKPGWDALLMPAHGLPALRHGTALDVLPAASYCFLPNLLGWPAGVVPVTTVRAGEESDRPNSVDRVVRTARRIEEGSCGLPIAVQIVAWRWREDVVLACMAAVEKAADQLRSGANMPAVA